MFGFASDAPFFVESFGRLQHDRDLCYELVQGHVDDKIQTINIIVKYPPLCYLLPMKLRSMIIRTIRTRYACYTIIITYEYEYHRVNSTDIIVVATPATVNTAFREMPTYTYTSTASVCCSTRSPSHISKLSPCCCRVITPTVVVEI